MPTRQNAQTLQQKHLEDQKDFSIYRNDKTFNQNTYNYRNLKSIVIKNKKDGSLSRGATIITDFD